MVQFNSKISDKYLVSQSNLTANPPDPHYNKRLIQCPDCGVGGCDQCPDQPVWVNNASRGSYNRLMLSSLQPFELQAVETLINGVKDSVDEHGSWEFGAVFDGKGRGTAVNYDIYGVMVGDLGSYAVIQVRQWEKRTKNGWARIRKNYFLLGRNEDRSFFAHSISSGVVHSAIKKDPSPQSPVIAAQKWIFGLSKEADLAKIRRQGDLALLPSKTPPKSKSEQVCNTVLIENSHLLKAELIVLVGDQLYAKNASLSHLPGQHPYIHLQGWSKVIVGQRASFWRFATPTID